MPDLVLVLDPGSSPREGKMVGHLAWEPSPGLPLGRGLSAIGRMAYPMQGGLA